MAVWVGRCAGRQMDECKESHSLSPYFYRYWFRPCFDVSNVISHI